MRKLLSAILVIAMLCGLLPALPVAAYTEIHVLATDFSLTEGEYGDTSPNGFDQTWYLKKYYPVEVYSGNYGTFVEMLSSEWLTYRVNVETAGTYTLAMDAATSESTSITVTVNGTAYSATVPSTSGVLNFTELTNLCSFHLNQGVNEIIIKNPNGPYFNYRELILSSDVGSGTESDYEEEESIIWWGNARWETGFNGYHGDFTAADFTGDYSGKEENIDTSIFTMEPGDYGTYTFNAPYTGVYAMQIYVSDLPEGTAAIRAVSGDYYAEFFMEYTGWSNTTDNLEDQPMYFTEGENTIVITNVGDATATVDAYDFGRLDATGYDSMQFISLVRKVSDMPAEGATPTFCPTPTPTVAPSQTPTPTVAPTATPTVAPTATPTVAPTATPTAAPTATPTVAPTATPTAAPTATPTATPVPTATIAPTGTVSYYAASAGIYKVTSNHAVTLVNETGSTVTLSEGGSGYLYLICGDNVLSTSDTSASLTFTALDNYGMDYISEIDTAYIPYATVHTSYGDRYTTGILSYLVDGTGTYQTGTNDVGEYIALSPDASVTLRAEVTADGAGIVYPYINICDNYLHTFLVTSDTGFYAELNKSLSGGWQTTCWADADKTDMELLYLREGINEITIKNTGSNTATVMGLRMSMTDGDDGIKDHETWGPQINLENLKVADVTAAATPTPVPTETPSPVNPDVTDAEMLTVYEAEDYTSGSLSETTYDGVATVKATSESTVGYTINVESDTIYNLYMNGAAWKDVSFDIAIDGTTYYYETLHFQGDRSTTYSYNEECVASIPLTKGTHTLSFTFYCDSFYFDNFTLENTYSKQYKLLYGLKEVSTSQGIYDILLSCGDLINIDVEADTADLFYPEMSFWSMVGKDYETLTDLISMYESVLAEELEAPTVVLYDASGNVTTSLGAGNYTVSINRSGIPSDVSFISAVYNGGKLAGNIQVLSSTDDVVTFTLTGVTAGSSLKLLVFESMEEVKPYSATGAYCDIYVATTGSSSNTGLSPDSPFATIVQALNKVKTINSNMTGDIIIHVAPGVYRSNVTIAIDQTMSGKNGHKVIIRAEDMNDRPVLSGGENLTGKWTQVSGENYWVASTTIRETRALYVNGYQAVLARSEDVYAGEYITPASPKNDYHVADGLMVSFSDYPEIPRDLEGETRLQMVYNLAWTNQRFPIDSVTYDSNYAYINATYPYYNAFLLSGHTSTVMPTEGRVFYLENAMALLDKPGEFYFDKTNRKIYYYPYSSEDMTTAETYCAATDVLMTIAGTTTTNKVENLEFQGISFRHGAWDEATTYGAAFNQTDELRRGTETGYSQHLMPAQIQVNNADSLVFDGCEFANLGSSAMYLIEGVTNSKVINCDFHDISGGGVSISNFLHNSTYSGSGRCKNIEIGNNIFRRISQEFMNLPAVAVYYADSVTVHHNDIKDLPYSGICIGWGWGYYEPSDTGNHIVSYNKIHEVCQVLDDGAQIYTLSDQPNMHLNDNYLIDPGNYRRGGVYFDEATGYISMCDNVIEQADDSGDYWLFARKYVNLNDNYVAYNHTDGEKPSYDTSGVTYTSNNINLTSWSDTAQRVMAEAGLEDKDRVAAVEYYPTWRTLPMLNLPASAVID